MRKEHTVTFTQVIQARFSVRSYRKAVLYTFTPACKEDRAFPAVAREIFPFGSSKLSLPFTVNQDGERGVENISQDMLPIDEMIT